MYLGAKPMYTSVVHIYKYSLYIVLGVVSYQLNRSVVSMTDVVVIILRKK